MESRIIEGKKAFTRFGRLLFVSGILTVLLGVLSLLNPMKSFSMLVIILSTGILVAGIMEIIYSLSNRKEITDWYWYLLGGILNLIVGLTLLYNPLITLIVLSIYMGLLILFKSIFAIITAFSSRKYGNEAWGRLLMIGVIGVLVAILLLMKPDLFGIAIGVWVGIGLIFIGTAQITLATHMRRLKKFGKELAKALKDQ